MDQSRGKSRDGFAFGATLGGLMETGSIAIAYRENSGRDLRFNLDNDTAVTEMSSRSVAGKYGIGDMTVFLGYSEGLMEDGSCTVAAAIDKKENCY